MVARFHRVDRSFASLAAIAAIACCVLHGLPAVAQAQNPWTPLSGPGSNGIGTMMLLTDGTVMAQGSGTSSSWYQLVPDSTGSYVNGHWNTLPSMHVARLYYGSAVLPNGQVFVAGGEYDNSGRTQPADNNTAEIYNPQLTTNAWSYLPQPLDQNSLPNPWPSIGDTPSAVLNNGNLIIGSIFDNESAIYDYQTNSWSAGGYLAQNTTEESWTLLPGGNVVTVDCAFQPTNGPDTTELYNFITDSWASDGSTPAGHNIIEASSAETGPAVLMPDGQVICFGATGHNILYTASTSKWSAAIDLPKVVDVDSTDQGPNTSNTYNTVVQGQCKDAPACLERDGKVLVCVGATGYNNNPKKNGGYPGGQYWFEYSPGGTNGQGTIASVQFPSGSISLDTPYDARMVDLPNGQILMSSQSNQLYVYTPSGGPNPNWAPTISSLGINPDASYYITGTQFNGMSQAAMYGDDAQQATNYPLVQFTNTGGQYYGRTFNHSTMAVATGTTPTSTNFTVSPTMPAGLYDLAVDANGIPGTPINFYTGIYVNHAWGGSQDGTLVDPFVSVTQGVSAAPGDSEAPSASYIFISGGGYPDDLTISTPCELINNGGGAVTIGTQVD